MGRKKGGMRMRGNKGRENEEGGGENEGRERRQDGERGMRGVQWG